MTKEEAIKLFTEGVENKYKNPEPTNEDKIMLAVKAEVEKQFKRQFKRQLKRLYEKENSVYFPMVTPLTESSVIESLDFLGKEK